MSDCERLSGSTESRPTKAAAECEAAVRLAPKSAQARYSYGAFLEKHEKLDDAIAQYREALQIDPRFIDAQIDLASTLFAKGERVGGSKGALPGGHPARPEACPALITIWERFLCAKAMLPRRLRNLNRRCTFIPTFRRPRKTCA